jgi:hypothetical protein
MIPKHIAHFYDGLSREEQTYFLALLAHKLTILARGYYDREYQAADSEHRSRLAALNEAQHRLTGHLLDAIGNVPSRANGESILLSVVHEAQQAGVEPDTYWAIDQALAGVSGGDMGRGGE